jgi:hypothetical protein
MQCGKAVCFSTHKFQYLRIIRRIKRTAAAIITDSPIHLQKDDRRCLCPYFLLFPRYPLLYSLSLLDMCTNFSLSLTWIYQPAAFSTYYTIRKLQRSSYRSLSNIRFLKRQRHKKRTALTRFTLYPYAPTVACDNPMRDVESQTQTVNSRFITSGYAIPALSGPHPNSRREILKRSPR